LSRSYLNKYLGGTLSNDRKEWKRYYFNTGLQHENIPDTAFKAWQLWWVSEEGMLKCAKMKELDAQKRPRVGTREPPSSSSGGSPRIGPVCSPSHYIQILHEQVSYRTFYLLQLLWEFTID
jgi:hypothetical protein